MFGMGPSLLGRHFATTSYDPFWNNVKYALHLDGPDLSGAYTDLKGNTFSGTNTNLIRTAQSKFGGASLYAGNGVTPSSLANVTAWSFGTSDFTYEAWVYHAAEMVGYVHYVGSKGDVASNNQTNREVDFYLQRQGAGTIAMSMMLSRNGTTTVSGDTAAIYLGSGVLSGWSLNQWHHFAWTRQGSNLYLFFNGNLVASGTMGGSTNVPHRGGSNYFIIGNGAHNSNVGGTGQVNGYLDDIRLTLGAARYTASFALPTAAFIHGLPEAPGAPTIGTATAGAAQATVSFTAPAYDGGSAITSYKVVSSPGNIEMEGTASPITVVGLTGGTPYTFTVTATNAVGTSVASAASNSVTPTVPVTVPGAPTIGTATAGDASASVTFTAPASNGGATITGYTVTSSPGGLTGTGTASPISVTGLTNGTAYTFTVTATNSAGTGAASAASNSVTPAAAGATKTYATFDPVTKGSTVTLSNGNLSSATGAGDTSARSTVGVSSGKWYWEFTPTSTNSLLGIVRSDAGVANATGFLNPSVAYYSANGNKYVSGTATAYGASFTTTDKIGVALNMDGLTVQFYKNGVAQGSAIAISAGTWHAACGNSSTSYTANFGATAFSYAAPAGFNSGLYTETSSGGTAAPKHYTTWNPSDKDTDFTLTNGNLTAASSSGAGTVRAVQGLSTGKWYWEIKPSTIGDTMIGIAKSTAALTQYPGNNTDSFGYYFANGAVYKGAANQGTGATYAVNDVIGVALDMDGGTLKFYKNNVLQVTISTGIAGATWYPAFGDGGAPPTVGVANFGKTALAYTPPTGYNAGVYVEGTTETTATLNPADKSSASTLSGGNLTIALGGADGNTRGTISRSSGKFYFEAKVNAIGATYGAMVGVMEADVPLAASYNSSAGQYQYWYKQNGSATTGYFFGNGSNITTYGLPCAVNDVIGVAVDLSSAPNTITFYKNGVSMGSQNIASGIYFPTVGDPAVSGQAQNVTFNFGATSFAYAVPAGFNAGWYVPPAAPASYPTLNPSDKSTGVALSNGNLTYTSSNGAQGSVRATSSKSTGKWYYEVTINQQGTQYGLMAGIMEADVPLTNPFIYTSGQYLLYSKSAPSSSQFFPNSGSPVSAGTQFDTGDRIGVAVDLTSAQPGISFYKNGLMHSSFSIAAGVYFPAITDAAASGNACSCTLNFGATAFTHAAPSGYSGWTA